MAKKKAARNKKLSTGSGTSRSNQAWLAKQLKPIKAFRDAHEPLTLTNYWELGRRSGKLMADAEHRGINAKPKNVAAELGYQSDASIRQAIKFSDNVTKKRAQALQEVDVPWRGVVCWLGVEAKEDSRQLFQEMTKRGLTNSSKIRRHIANEFNKQASPRKIADPSKMAEKTREKAHELTALLLAFVDVCKRSEDQASRSERAALKRGLKKLGKALAGTSDQIRSTRSYAQRIVRS